MPAPRRTGMSRVNSAAVLEATSQPGWSDLVKEFLEHKEKRGLSPNSVIYYRYRMQSWLLFVQDQHRTETPEEVDSNTIVEWTHWVRTTRHCTPNTARHGMIALRAFYNWLIKQKRMDVDNPVTDAPKPVVLEKVIESFQPEQITAMLKPCDEVPDFYGYRDKAAMLLLLDTGLRASELCDIRLEDVNWDNQTILITNGKGSKQRFVPFAHSVFVALRAYERLRPTLLAHDYLFVNHFGERLDRDRLRELIIRRGTHAKITGVRLSPHTFRHTFAVQYLLNGGDALSLQAILGHSTLDMTKRYVHFAQTMQKFIHDRVSPADAIAPQVGPGRKRIDISGKVKRRP